jgi:hypothetical protein
MLEETSILKSIKNYTIFFCAVIAVCLLLLLEPVRNVLISFGETHIIHGALTKSVWHQFFTYWAIIGIVVTVLFLGAVIVFNVEQHLKKTNQLVIQYFVFIVVGLFLSSFFVLMRNPQSVQRFTLNGRGAHEFFMDFFMVLPALQNRDPYIPSGGGKIYLPLANLLFYPFSQMHDVEVIPELWGKTKMAIMSVFLWLSLLLMVFFGALNQLRKKYQLPV